MTDLRQIAEGMEVDLFSKSKSGEYLPEYLIKNGLQINIMLNLDKSMWDQAIMESSLAMQQADTRVYKS